MAYQENPAHLKAIESLSTEEIRAKVQAIIAQHSSESIGLTDEEAAQILALSLRNLQTLNELSSKLEFVDTLK